MRTSRARTTRTTGPPGACAPPGDNVLLLESLAGERLARGARPLDPSTGTGVLAIAAASRGARATVTPAAPRAGDRGPGSSPAASSRSGGSRRPAPSGSSGAASSRRATGPSGSW
ncbi:hypothetical protein ACWV2X_28005 [Streptomyces hydrogenans]